MADRSSLEAPLRLRSVTCLTTGSGSSSTGSYINRRVLAEADLHPEELVVATLPGFDIQIGPLANIRREAGRVVYGVLATATHAELDRLYQHAREVLGGTYLPEAVLCHVTDGPPPPRPRLHIPRPHPRSRRRRLRRPHRHFPAASSVSRTGTVERLESFKSGNPK